MTSKPNVQSEGRSFRRIPVPESTATAVLQFGRKAVRVWITDESAGGVGVYVKVRPNIQVNDQAILKTAGGWFEVRVVHISFVDAEGQRKGRRRIRIGLERLAEITRPPKRPWSYWLGSLGDMLRQKGSTRVGSNVSIAILILLIPLAAAQLLLWTRSQQVSGQVMGWAKKTKNQAAASTPNGWMPGSPRPESSDQPQATAETHNLVELRQQIQLHRGPESLVVPEVARVLELTADQLTNLTQLIETTRNALAEIDRKRVEGSAEELAARRAMVVRVAREEALKLLTRQQRTKWSQLTE